MRCALRGSLVELAFPRMCLLLQVFVLMLTSMILAFLFFLVNTVARVKGLPFDFGDSDSDAESIAGSREAAKALAAIAQE